MDLKSELERMRKEEETLLERIKRKIELQAILKRQRERLYMLRSLAGEGEHETAPTTKEVEELSKIERRNEEKASKTLFLSLQASNIERTFCQEAKLVDKDGNTECDVKVIVAVKNVKNNKGAIKPIDINFSLDKNAMEGEIKFSDREQSEIPKTIDKVIECFVPKATSTVNKDSKDVKKRSAKPRVTSDVKVCLPRIKIDDCRKNRKQQSETTKQKQQPKSFKGSKRTESDTTKEDEEIEKLKELLTRAQRKRNVANYQISSDEDDISDHDGLDCKELPRSKKSRRSSLAGAMKPEASANPSNNVPSMDDIQASQSTEPTAGETPTGPEPVADEPTPEAAEESPEMDQPAAEQEVEGAKQEGAPEHPKETQDSC
ncbi:hypothetical protein RF55_18846 [Lasius niger]|uniref:Uncharacterized protein n=1 Tax=Lasius niger TaxID=67767 RepID=A0A0J7K0R4_LASNI|nr:hypothetical protein RF55_18846 [Lasius niger]